MTEFEKVKYVRQCCFSILPQLYCDRFTIEEQIGKIVLELNKLITNNNKLEDYIKEIIREVIESGEIEEIIKDMLANYILNVKFPPNNITPASGDGTKDDTEAIQGCIDYAFERGGMSVYFPSGNYLTQSLTLKDNVSLVGFDRYSTKLVLKGGAINPLLSGSEINTGMHNIYFDGHAEIQVNDLNLCNLNVKSAIITNCGFMGGVEDLNITVSEDLQLSELVFKTSVECGLVLSGSGKIIGDNLKFGTLSSLSGVAFVKINTNNAILEKLVFNSNAPTGVILNGNLNTVKFYSSSTIPYIDNGTNNNVLIYGRKEYEYFSESYNLKTPNYTEDVTEYKTINTPSLTENVITKNLIATDIHDVATNEISRMAKEITETTTEDKIEVIGKTHSLNSENLILNPTQPATYRTPTNPNDFYKKIPFKDMGGDPYDVMVLGENNVLPELRNHNISSILPESEIHGIKADYLFSRKGDVTEYKITEEPVFRSQAFININRTASTPWIVQEAIQTVVGPNANEKIASSFKEMFSYRPGNLEHITSVNVNNAMANPVSNLDNGMLWAQWNIVKNNGFKSNGIAQEVNVRNTYDNWFDVADPLTSVPENFMYCEQIYPDWSTKHSTRGISIQPGSAALGEPIGFSTGVLVSGFVDRGIYIDTQIQYRDPVTHLVPNAPIGVVFGNRLQNLIAIKDTPTTNGWFINKEADYLLFRKDGSNWFMAMDKTDNSVYFNNKIFSMKNNGRFSLGTATKPTGENGVGITVLDDVESPIILKRSTSAGVAPGVNYGTLRFQPGTNPGTLMLTAYSGTSDTGVIIADNIGGGNV